MTIPQTGFESLILSYLANALWQVPLIYAAGRVAASALRPLGPAAEHRVWIAVLLLQTVLPASSAIPWESLRALLDLWRSPVRGGVPQVSVVMGPGTAFGNPHLPAWLLGTIVLAYAAATAWFAIRFGWRLYKIRLLGRKATAITLTGDIAGHWTRCAARFEVANATLAASTAIYGPITIGITRKFVLLPEGMLSAVPDAELRAAIAHEFAHMQRHDFLKNLLCELVSLPVRFHPILSATRHHIMETREMVCDQMAASLDDQHEYARSLLRLASLLVNGALPATPHAIGIFDATTFERRVMRLTRKPALLSRTRRIATLAASALLGAGICVITLAFTVHFDAFAAGDEHRPSQPNHPIAVKGEIMEGQILHKVIPVYPDSAKNARIQGKVLLDAIIGKEGAVEQLKVISGPAALQQSARDAVRQWTYKPFLLNGAPVEVRTTIYVRYTLKD